MVKVVPCNHGNARNGKCHNFRRVPLPRPNVVTVGGGYNRALMLGAKSAGLTYVQRPVLELLVCVDDDYPDKTNACPTVSGVVAIRKFSVAS